MIIFNGVEYTELQALESALDAIQDMSNESRQAVINDFNGVENFPPNISPLRIGELQKCCVCKRG